MRAFECVFLCVSFFIIYSSSFVSSTFFHEKPKPFDPYNCSCLTPGAQGGSSGSVNVGFSGEFNGQSSSGFSGKTTEQNTYSNNVNATSNSSDKTKGENGSSGQIEGQGSSSSEIEGHGGSSDGIEEQGGFSGGIKGHGGFSGGIKGQGGSSGETKIQGGSSGGIKGHGSYSGGIKGHGGYSGGIKEQGGFSGETEVQGSSSGGIKGHGGSSGGIKEQGDFSGGIKGKGGFTGGIKGQNGFSSGTKGQGDFSSNVNITSGSSGGTKEQGSSSQNTTAGSGNQYQQNTPSQAKNQNQRNTSTSTNISGHGNVSTSIEGSNTFSSNFNFQGSFQGTFKKVYAFGDSFTDTGNAVSMEGLKSFVGGIFQNFYGSSTNAPGHRLSNGRLIVDFLCDSLGLPSIQAYKQTSGSFSAGVNFAIAGSTCLSSDFFFNHKISHSFMWKSKPESVLTEIDWFNKFLLNSDCKGKGEAECKALLQDSLFWVGAIGFSDYARIFGAAISGRSLTEASVDHSCKVLKAILDRGAQYIVVQGLPPAGCCPLQLLLNPSKERDNMGCSSGINSMIQAHNDLLQKKIGEFRAQYSGSVIVYADTWSAYKSVLANYKKFNFLEPFKACCGSGGGLLNFDLHSLCGSTGTTSCDNPNNHISWDGIHFTEAMHKVLANMFFKQGFCSPSFDVMIKAKLEAKVGVN